MIQELYIEGPLPGLNEIIHASKRQGRRKECHGRGRGSRLPTYDELKREWNTVVKWHCVQQHVRKVVGRAHFTFTWRELTKRRDPDNIAGGGQKIVFDGLQSARIIENDSWPQVAGITHRFERVRESPGVVVRIEEV